MHMHQGDDACLWLLCVTQCLHVRWTKGHFGFVSHDKTKCLFRLKVTESLHWIHFTR